MTLEYKGRFPSLSIRLFCIFKCKTDVATGFLFAFKEKKGRTFDVSKMCLIPYVFFKKEDVQTRYELDQ